MIVWASLRAPIDEARHQRASFQDYSSVRVMLAMDGEVPVIPGFCGC